MRYWQEWFRREVLWRLPFRRTKWDSLFRGEADVSVKPGHRPIINGRIFDDWQLQTLAMAPSGAKVVVTDSQKSFSLVTKHGSLIEPGEENTVVLEVDKDGSYYIYIELILFCGPQKGFGASAFFRMAETARRLGFQRIDLLAAGGTGYKYSWTRVFNGYYSWARFGFDAKLLPATLIKLQNLGGPTGATRLVDVIRKNPLWWKAHGDGCAMSFDLRRGSASWQTLKRYLRTKGR